MGSTHWGNGFVMYGKVDGEHVVVYFENDEKVFYDAKNQICAEGWEKELEPYEGLGYKGMPFEIYQKRVEQGIYV